MAEGCGGNAHAARAAKNVPSCNIGGDHMSEPLRIVEISDYV